MVKCSFPNLVVAGSNTVAVTSTSDIAPVSSKEFLDVQATIEFKFIFQRVRDMIIKYSYIKNYITFPPKLLIK